MRHFDRWFAKTNELRTDGTDYLVRAAQLGGARRVIAQSFTGWNNVRDGRGVKTEAGPARPDPGAGDAADASTAIRYLERTVHAGRATGGPGAALRQPLRARHRRCPASTSTLIRARKLPLIGGGTGVWSFVHVDDAAAATVAALDHGTPRRLQHRRRRPGPGVGVAPVPGGDQRRPASAARAGLARPARRR